MESATRQSVPQETAVRSQIRDAARTWVNKKNLLPPQTKEFLLNHAQNLLSELQLESDYLNYAMIMLNNALWEDVIAHIPQQDRLLLLPICLRNHEECKAPCDELGLICEECGKCLIPELTRKAEDSGLNVLVSESSSSVSEWVESGEIRAVIGVSCLHSLEKAFPSMLRFAVPGIAIPLNRDGCKNTSFELSFLDEALAVGEDSYIFSSPSTDIQDHLKNLFSVDSVNNYLNASTPYLQDFTDLVYGALCDNGKHYRPMITYGTYCSLLNCSEFPEYLNPIALAVECFHKASLIHDDIEDNDDSRYDKPTMHKQAGISVALNVGDFLIGEGYRLLSHESIPKEIRAELYTQASQAHSELSLGQAQEFESLDKVVSLEQSIETHRLKTAPAFRVAMFLGAIAAGKFDEYRDVFQRISDNLGIAYQIADDLEDIHTNPASVVDCLMRSNNIDRESARIEISELLNDFKLKIFTTLEEITDPVLKIFLYRLIGKVLKDV